MAMIASSVIRWNYMGVDVQLFAKFYDWCVVWLADDRLQLRKGESKDKEEALMVMMIVWRLRQYKLATDMQLENNALPWDTSTMTMIGVLQ
jgi:hypothetical protein